MDLAIPVDMKFLNTKIHLIIEEFYLTSYNIV